MQHPPQHHHQKMMLLLASSIQFSLDKRIPPILNQLLLSLHNASTATTVRVTQNEVARLVELRNLLDQLQNLILRLLANTNINNNNNNGMMVLVEARDSSSSNSSSSSVVDDDDVIGRLHHRRQCSWEDNNAAVAAVVVPVGKNTQQLGEDALPPHPPTAAVTMMAIVHHLDTLVLPLMDILQFQHCCSTNTSTNTTSASKEGDKELDEDEEEGSDGNGKCTTTTTTSAETNVWMIQRSASYACMERAASILESLWKLRQRMIAICGVVTTDDMATTASTPHPYTHHRGSTIQKLILPSLISCAMALSSLDIEAVKSSSVNDNDASMIIDKDNYDEEKSEKKEQNKIQHQPLDRGDDCAMAILSCIRSFLHFDDANGNIDINDDDFGNGLFSKKQHAEDGRRVDEDDHLLSQEVGSAMRGALVARLVQGCLTLLPPMMSLSYAERKNDNLALQLEALNTLRTLLIRVPLPDLWRSILPGCFARLYQTAMLRLQYPSSSMCSPSSSSFRKVASVSVRVLAFLLDTSLSSVPPSNKDNQHQHQHLAITDVTNENRNVSDKTNSIQSITASLMTAVQQSLAKSQRVERIDEEDRGSLSPVAPIPIPSKEEKKMLEFATEVNKRLAGPLLVLLGLLPTNRNMDVQKSGLYLSQTIMIHVRKIWTESNYKALERKSLEFCLMMMVGDDENIEDIELKRCSYNILHSYKTHHQCGGWKQKICQSIVPTILELMEALPTFARSGREIQVRHNLRLIRGYLLISFRDMLNDDDIDFDWLSSEKSRKSDIGHALSCTEAAKIVKNAFSVLFAPDVDTMTCNTVTSIQSALSSDLSEIAPNDGNSSRYCRFLYLGDETAVVARKTVHLFARVLGAKRCAFLIDDGIAEIFETHSQSCSEYLFLANEGIDRQRLLSGECIFVSELLRGISGPSKPLTSISLTRIFSSLASSVLPLIVSDSLWTPTVLEAGANSDNLKGQSHEFRTTGSKQSCNQTSKVQIAYQSATVMNSNAVFISVMMGVIREFTLALGGGMRLHLPIVLFPILERASPIGNHSIVQSAAIATLQDITQCVGSDDISSLIASNFDYLVDVLALRLRKYGRESISMKRSCVGLVDFILRSSILYEGRNASSGNGPIAAGHVTTVSNLLTCFLNYLDGQSVMTNLRVLDATRVLQSMCTFMESSIDVHLSSYTPVTPEVDDYGWLQRLDFDLTAESMGHAFDDILNDGIATAEPEINDGIELADELLLGDSHNARKNDRDETIFTHEIIAINTILSRCCYLLCYSNLQIQVICCETILSGFHSLGKIGLWQKNRDGESARNPMFRAIAEFWPSIIARLRSVSASLAAVNRLSRSDLSVRNVMAADQVQSYYSQAGLEVLISRLLLVVSELCLSSDGFFADRFENDAYPIIATLMTDLLSTCFDNGGHQHQPLPFAEEKQSLLLSILHCFKCTFESGCRNCLVGIIPSAGAMIIPLLAFRGPAGEGATNALKAMATVDSDALWRELHNLSGNPFPCNPIFISASNSSVTQLLPCSIITVSLSNNKRRQGHDFVLSKNALELMEFIKCIPEQEL